MIVVDSSALMAIILNEAAADACQSVLETGDTIEISAATLAEALIVADRRGYRDAMSALVETVGMTVVEVTPARSRLVADAYARWGKGVHRAALNFGDCFAYALAEERRWPLLYVGNDFAKTDIASAL